MKLTLIRHGTTTWNEQARYQGWTDVPLAASGIQEAGLLREAFTHRDVTAVISSDLARCTETARIGFPDHLIRTTPEFRELSFGAWEGLTYHQCLDRDPDLYRQWIDNPAAITPPDGESLTAFQNRILQAIETIRLEYSAEPDSHLVIVTHGGPIRFLLQQSLRSGDTTPAYHTVDIPHLHPCGYVHLQLSSDPHQHLPITMESLS